MLLSVENLTKHFPVTGGVFLRRTGTVHALNGVSFTLEKGETLGIVGESGCGKTTLGRCIMGLHLPTQGRVMIKGKPITSKGRRFRKQLALDLQMIFQDPFDSLDARQTVRQILAEKYEIHGRSTGDMNAELVRLLAQVGLPPDALDKFPHEFSGGQRQRIGIARAISLEPSLVICDEPVSALDVSVQSTILNLLLDLQQAMGLSFLFISHDLSVVRHVADRIAVMYLGRIVEMAGAEQIYSSACHPYTRALLSAVPVPDPSAGRPRTVLKGEVPSVEKLPRGCGFHTRCPHAEALCRTQSPSLNGRESNRDHQVACHLFG